MMHRLQRRRLPTRLLILASVTFGTSACDSIRHRQLLQATEFDPITFTVEAPVTARKGLLIVDAQLGADSRPVELMVDTGAYESKLTLSTAQAEGIAPVLHRDNSDTFGRSRKMPVGQIDRLQIGGVTVRKLSAGLLDWPPSAITPCLAADGLLGANALRGLSWSVDFGVPSLTLSTNADSLGIPADAGFVDVKMPRLSATPVLSVTVNGRQFDKVIVDLGSNGGLVLPLKSLKKLGIPEARQITIDDASSSSIYGAARQHSIRAPVRLQIGGLPEVEVMAQFTDDAGAKIGTAALSHFRLWLDHARRQLALQPAPQTAAFEERSLPQGILLGVDWRQDQWRASYLEYPRMEGPPAGLKIGQTFDSVNGLSPSDVFDGWCDYIHEIRAWHDEQETLSLVNTSNNPDPVILRRR